MKVTFKPEKIMLVLLFHTDIAAMLRGAKLLPLNCIFLNNENNSPRNFVSLHHRDHRYQC